MFTWKLYARWLHVYAHSQIPNEWEEGHFINFVNVFLRILKILKIQNEIENKLINFIIINTFSRTFMIDPDTCHLSIVTKCNTFSAENSSKGGERGAFNLIIFHRCHFFRSVSQSSFTIWCWRWSYTSSLLGISLLGKGRLRGRCTS